MADIDVRITTNATQAAGSFDQLRDSMRAAGTAQIQMTNGLGAATSQLSAAQSAALAAAGSAYRLAASMAPVGSAAASAAQAITRLGSEARSLSALSGVAGQARTLATAMREQATATGAASSSIRGYAGPVSSAAAAMSQMAAQARALTSSVQSQAQAAVAAASAQSTLRVANESAAAATQRAAGAIQALNAGMGAVSGNTANTASGIRSMAAAASNSAVSLGAMASQARALASAMQAQAAMTGAATSALRQHGQVGTTSALAAAYGARQVLNMAHGFVELSDAGTNAINRLRNVTGSAEEAESTFRKLVDVSKRTYTEVESNTMLFQRMSVALKETGRSGDQVLRIIETLGKAVSTSGASAVEAKNALIQLSQAFNRGVLRGDELRSISEQLPVVLDIVAAKMGVTTTKLKVMALENGIATTLIADAVEAAAGRIDADFSKISPTIEGSMNTLKAALTEAVFDFNKFTGASTIIAGAILLVANNMGIFITVAAGLTLVLAINSLSRLAVVFSLLNIRTALATVGLGAFRIQTALASVSMASLNTMMLANPVGLIVVGIAAAVAAMIYFRSAIASVLQTLGNWFGVGPQMAAFLKIISDAFQFILTKLGLISPTLGKVTAEMTKQSSAASGLSGNLDALANAYGDTGKSVLDFKNQITDPAAINEAKKVVSGYASSFAGLAAKQNAVASAAAALAAAQLRFGAAAKAGNTEAQTAIINAHTEVAVATNKVNEHKSAMTTLTEAENTQTTALVATIGQSQRFAAVIEEGTVSIDAQGNSIRTITEAAPSQFEEMGSAAASMASSIESSLSSAISSVISYIGSLISRVRDAISALAELAGAKSSASATDTVAAPDSVAPTDSASTSATSQLSAYAVGGQFMVGGSGGVDSRLVQFWASPDERVVIETPMQQKISDQYRARLPKFANGGMFGGGTADNPSGVNWDPDSHSGRGGSGMSGSSESTSTFSNPTYTEATVSFGKNSLGEAYAKIDVAKGYYNLLSSQYLTPGPYSMSPDSTEQFTTAESAVRAITSIAKSGGVTKTPLGMFDNNSSKLISAGFLGGPPIGSYEETERQGRLGLNGLENFFRMLSQGASGAATSSGGASGAGSQIAPTIEDVYAQTAKENYLVGRATAPSVAGARGDSGADILQKGPKSGGSRQADRRPGLTSGGGRASGGMTQINMNISTPNATTFLKNSNAIRQKQRVQSASS